MVPVFFLRNLREIRETHLNDVEEETLQHSTTTSTGFPLQVLVPRAKKD
jgi:hypothetical protein